MPKRDSVAGLAETLMAARAKAALSQVQAAAAAGLAQTTISQFERGAKTPTLATLYKLAKAYGVDVCELLPREPEAEGRQSGTGKPKKSK